MASLGFSEKVASNAERINSMEEMLGKGLMMPFNNTNAGARKLMFGTQKEHVSALIRPEKAILETGYEIRYGDYSSSITKADANYKVVAKIVKFHKNANHHYWLILEDSVNKKLDVVERISYHYITESYCYLYNNEYMDNLNVGDIIPENTIVQKSSAFDEYNNRADGINMNVAYLALDDNMEDSIVFSDVAAGKLSCPLFKPVRIMINDNDIPVNLYGTDTYYKIIPDIGEEIIDANLIALRKEKKEESYFTQSVNNLSKLMISDDKRQVHGRVIDVNIYCNNPEILDAYYYSQIKMYYKDQQRYSSEIVAAVSNYVALGYTMSYELEKLYGISKRIQHGDPFMDQRTFSNIILEIGVLEERQLEAGDKSSNRYGGKGVCSAIWPQKFMPRYKNGRGEWEYVDAIFNSSTMINRENVGQVFELSINHIGEAIINKIISERMNLNEAYGMIYKFVSMCSPEQAAYMHQRVSEMTPEEFMFYIESIVNSGSIQLSMKPISESFTIDKLMQIYDAFPWVEQNHVEVAMVGSDGSIRYIPCRRSIVIGKQYIYKLKQYSEEKFSATSLSSTNIRNENTKSRVRKDFKELYPNTPIRFGKLLPA